VARISRRLRDGRCGPSAVPRPADRRPRWHARWPREVPRSPPAQPGPLRPRPDREERSGRGPAPWTDRARRQAPLGTEPGWGPRGAPPASSPSADPAGHARSHGTTSRASSQLQSRLVWVPRMHLTSLVSDGSMDRVRRTGVLLLAIGYGLSFVAVCLAACLMGPAVADHGCCPGEDGIRAADRDCCSVTPGVSHGGAQVAATLPTLAVDSPFKVGAPPPVAPAVPVTVSTSPPLILRV
jgi:hypothetical protein